MLALFTATGMDLSSLVSAGAHPSDDELPRQMADCFSDPYAVDCKTHVPEYHGKVVDGQSLPLKTVKTN